MSLTQPEALLQDGLVNASEWLQKPFPTTPLLDISHAIAANGTAHAKLESFNATGSIKDRTAFGLIRNALEEGRVHSSTTVVESTSGNLGIALAAICNRLDIGCICVVDDLCNRRSIDFMKIYGAIVVEVNQSEISEHGRLGARINRVKQILESGEQYLWTNQYCNLYNKMAHEESTALEIDQQMNGEYDAIICPVSTCGTAMGIADFLRAHNRQASVIAVDIEGSQIFSKGESERLIPGLGSAFHPPLLEEGGISEAIIVSNLDCVAGCRELVAKTNVFAGGSSGACFVAAKKYLANSPGKRCVLVFPDSGDRYVDTIYNNKWVEDLPGGVRFIQHERSAARHTI